MREDYTLDENELSDATEEEGEDEAQLEEEEEPGW
jgi:hypothetical protein